METRKVSVTEIEALYAFTRKHFVEHYDLQTELTDHLANAIEQQWQRNPALAFDDALAAEFKKFGIFGFSDVVEQRGKALGRRYRKLMWSYYREFFSPPKILLTAAVVMATAIVLYYNAYIALGIYMVVQLVYFRKMLINKKAFEKKTQQTGKKWMLEDMIFNGVTLSAVMGLWANLSNIMLHDANMYGTAAMALVFVLILLYNHIVVYAIPAKAEHYLKETYPEYAIEISA